ncbi:putative disease resistance protein [Senna tora]|uniref:Putative disease resistance protein n=1 Tax=Senna tora TaxID=362788 RepID=A0A834XGW5_9FABA|nr:putative disease resistance protein [Senna tora]
MEKLVEIIWDVSKYLCGCAKEEAVYIYDLEENLQKLKEEWEEVVSMKQDLKTRVDEAERYGLMRRTDEVDKWMNKVEALQKPMQGHTPPACGAVGHPFILFFVSEHFLLSRFAFFYHMISL